MSRIVTVVLTQCRAFKESCVVLKHKAAHYHRAEHIKQLSDSMLEVLFEAVWTHSKTAKAETRLGKFSQENMRQHSDLGCVCSVSVAMMTKVDSE